MKRRIGKVFVYKYERLARSGSVGKLMAPDPFPFAFALPFPSFPFPLPFPALAAFAAANPSAELPPALAPTLLARMPLTVDAGSLGCTSTQRAMRSSDDVSSVLSNSWHLA